MMEFVPNISKVEIIDFRPHMIECGFDYYMLAEKSSHQRIEIQCVMSALAIEVILKSFNAQVVGNLGQINETYKFDRSSLPKKADPHDLVTLTEALTPSVCTYLFDKSDLKVIEKNRSIFKSSRYVYEQTANTIHFDDIIKLAAKTLCKVIYLYKKRGCKDPFILHAKVNELYFGSVQQFILP